ncbi:MAG: phosphatase PAP2 family protein [Povalibacter sp.]
MESLANTLAEHAVAALLGVAAAMLLLTVSLWHAIYRYGAAIWRAASHAWERFRHSALASHLRQIPVLGRALRRSMTMARYLGFHAILSFVLAFVALGVFFKLADEIGLDEQLARFDTLLSSALALHAPQTLLHWMAVITVLGNRVVVLPLGALVTLVLVWRRHYVLAIAWVIATGAGALLNLLLKSMFERTRPPHEHGLIAANGWSFPSGHASGSMLMYGLLAYIVIRHTPRAWHLPVAVIAVLVIVFVGFSRVLLQVHYFSDVLAGYASAAAWGSLCIAGYEIARRRSKKQGNGPRT